MQQQQPPFLPHLNHPSAGLKRKLEDGGPPLPPPPPPPGPPAAASGPASHAHAAPPGASAPTNKQRPPMPPPYMLASLVPESEMFADLLKMEQKMDWTMLRKKAEAQDALGKPIKIKRTLRVYVSNTAFNQPWQVEQAREAGQQEVNIDVETGDGVPAWQLRIEGRLIDTNNQRIDKTVKRKFSQLLTSVVVEFDNREPQNFPQSNIVEWYSKSQPSGQSHDGFEIRRRGDLDVNCRIVIRLDQYPDRFQVKQPLCDMIGVAEASRAEIMSAMWKYVKTIGAQDRDDPTKLLPINGLEKIVNPAQGPKNITDLPTIVNAFLALPEPIIIHHRIEVSKDRNIHPKVFDIPIEVEDPLKSKYHAAVQGLEGPQLKEVMAAEDEVARLAHTIRSSRQKRDFLQNFASDPSAFIQRWLANQSRDLDLILGNSIGTLGTNGGGVREEDLRRSDLFNLPWVEEAVVIQEGVRLERQRELEMRARQQQQQVNRPMPPGVPQPGPPGSMRQR